MLPWAYSILMNQLEYRDVYQTFPEVRKRHEILKKKIAQNVSEQLESVELFL